MSKTIVFTDGSSRGNPGPGGFGSIVIYKEGKERMVKELGGREEKTTNNRMELQAFISALVFTDSRSVEDVVVYTDSEYIKKGATVWMYSWVSNNWRTKTGDSVLNKDLWIQVFELLKNRDEIEIKVIPGHSGVLGNERCDVIATAFADNKKMYLYDGTIDNYPVKDILDIKVGFNKIKNKISNKKAYSYVSSVNKIVKIHKDWDSCKKEVDGKSGARFKKVFSKSEEAEVILDFSK